MKLLLAILIAFTLSGCVDGYTGKIGWCNRVKEGCRP